MLIPFNTLEKRDEFMRKKNNGSRQSNPPQGQPPAQPPQSSVGVKKKTANNPWAMAIIPSIVSAIVSGVLTLLVTSVLPNAYQIPVKIDSIKNDLSRLETMFQKGEDDRKEDLSKLETMLQKEADERKEDIKYLWERVFGLNEPYNTRTDLRPADEMKTAISNDYVINWLNASGNTELRATATIAYSAKTGEKYTVEQLATQKLLLPYISGTQEVYFYGQLSENGRWDGDCIINVYEDGKLVFIRDAEYDDGYLVRGKSVFSYTINEKTGQDVWAITNRTNEGSFSGGETMLYAWKRDFEQLFSFDTVMPVNILNANDIRVYLESTSYLYAYYYGNTSDGFFNDTTGNAYMVYFYEDGTVRQLYSGNFVDGTYNDNTGNAWFILRERENNISYMYFKGYFSNGRHLRDNSHTFYSLGPPLSLEQINEIIEGRTFNVKLNWAEEALAQ